MQRQPERTEAIAVGSKRFVRSVKEKLGLRAKGRKILKALERFILREPERTYNDNLTGKSGLLSVKNTFKWNIDSNKSTC